MRQCLGSNVEACGASVAANVSQFFFDAGELRFDLLVDSAEPGFDDAAAGRDRGVGDDVRRRKLAERLGQSFDSAAEMFVVGRIQVQRDVGGAGGQSQRFADPVERDLRLAAPIRGE